MTMATPKHRDDLEDSKILKSMRVKTPLWNYYARIAKREGLTVSDVMRFALERFRRAHRRLRRIVC